MSIIKSTLELIVKHNLNTYNQNDINNVINLDNTNIKDFLHPTTENINFYVQFDICAFLAFLFPNTFKNIAETENYYLKFCEKAKNLNEEKSLYNIESLYYEGNINVDLTSGFCTYWNNTTKKQTYMHTIEIFTPNNIKNDELKKEITQLYKDNYKHINQTLHNNQMISGNINLFCPFGYIYLTPYNVKFYDYYKSLPFNDFVKLLRINRTYNLDKIKRKELIKNYKKYLRVWRVKKDYTYKLNFKDNSFQIDNEFIRVNASISYSYKPKIEKQFYSEYETYNVEMFN